MDGTCIPKTKKTLVKDIKENLNKQNSWIRKPNRDANSPQIDI